MNSGSIIDRLSASLAKNLTNFNPKEILGNIVQDIFIKNLSDFSSMATDFQKKLSQFKEKFNNKFRSNAINQNLANEGNSQMDKIKEKISNDVSETVSEVILEKVKDVAVDSVSSFV